MFPFLQICLMSVPLLLIPVHCQFLQLLYSSYLFTVSSFPLHACSLSVPLLFIPVPCQFLSSSYLFTVSSFTLHTSSLSVPFHTCSLPVPHSSYLFTVTSLTMTCASQFNVWTPSSLPPCFQLVVYLYSFAYRRVLRAFTLWENQPHYRESHTAKSHPPEARWNSCASHFRQALRRSWTSTC